MEDSQVRIMVTDCEGPITKNDNAAELAAAVIPSGASFFAKISLYDDYLAEIRKRPDYKAGDTLKLILPFLKAYGLDNESMEEFSRRSIAMIPQAGEVLRTINSISAAYIVSTSYSTYIKAVCDSIGFPFANCYCTHVNLDQTHLSAPEKKEVRRLAERIVQLPDFKLPDIGAAQETLDVVSAETIAELDRIFWEDLPGMAIYELVKSVNPVGGPEKARSIEAAAGKAGVMSNNVIYFGDSITDTEAFRLLNQVGGISVSFNGNHWAVKEAQIAVTGQSALPIFWLASAYIQYGAEVLKDLFIYQVTDKEVERISELSSSIRKQVRTETIGSLG